MGRPRTFDIDKALNVTADMFWRRGYDNTSIGDLTKAIGISAPSFYFAFGSKEAVFLRIVEVYLARQNEIVERALREPDARAVAASLLFGISDLLTSPDHAPGCLILNNALPICDDHPFRARWAEGRSAIRNELAERFRKDRESGLAFPEDWDPADTARLVVSLVWGLAVEIHSGASSHEIQRMISHFLGMWPED
ncbi:TetR/AcrR family transcriptional regulator [Methylosinus sp. LW4]|uniref:TetR/AcrR family transcriptional regulator n=1 Tax=Methylosinus sp. LW4 TaxID=136993 RepID=UPI0003782AC0|nr:TetR/AcrR family transcriptional regulator [Methylosinus sp. LW4]